MHNRKIFTTFVVDFSDVVHLIIMKRYFLQCFALLMAALLLGSCKTQKKQLIGTPVVVATAAPERNSKPRDYIPKAVIYTTNGDYNNCVPVTLNDARTALVSFPDPRDLRYDVAPLPLANGYLLDRRGVGYNTAFTRWTYAEYAQLPAVPTPDELMQNIIPEARVTNVVTLPITLSQALADTAAINRVIRDDFRSLDTLKP